MDYMRKINGNVALLKNLSYEKKNSFALVLLQVILLQGRTFIWQSNKICEVI